MEGGRPVTGVVDEGGVSNGFRPEPVPVYSASNGDFDRGSPSESVAHLAAAFEHLETVLETVDLDRERDFAEAVLSALEATDLASRLEQRRVTDTSERRRAGRR